MYSLKRRFSSLVLVVLILGIPFVSEAGKPFFGKETVNGQIFETPDHKCHQAVTTNTYFFGIENIF